MPRLLLLRHAKSSWLNPSLDDFDRPLNERGRAAAPVMGMYMAREGFKPDHVLCSSSRRTRETLACVLPHFKGEETVAFRDDLYDSSEDSYLEIIREHGGNAGNLLVVGHNPATRETARTLIAAGSKDLRARIDEKYPTASLTVIDFDVPTWADILPRSGRIAAFMRPRDLQMEDDPGL
ncbi:phosphohistidine phosphatase [Rhodobium orientis]|uniref:Phosphohistidine phosphatase n=1 Tax=Rhodobium orientis TaxID=34017 RepID=A0A327JFR1_9HYPH|nr:histidine phosphatase family protein [Rhodobium orientis]MBB4301848.1 phosphohistidine phosphatase [Rhodobium orientis]MBK5948377.1 hypothetical protein [Rhodobium orientis]RAI25210.1 hypothetical protein CH339_19235 [Rhodobium orientis]